MADTTINKFVARGTASQRIAFTPDPPPTVTGQPKIAYLWFEEDTGDTYSWNGTSSTWSKISGTGLGNVVGPASAVSGHVATFSGTTGKIIQDGGALGGAASLNVGMASGTVAAGNDTRITGAAQKASNLSDLASASTARTNLGLATVASSASAADLSSGTLAAARGGAGTITGALKGDGSGVVSQAAAADLSNGTTGTGSVVLTASPTITGTLGAAAATLSGTLNVGDVATTVGVVPAVTATSDIGSTTQQYRDVYSSRNIYSSGITSSPIGGGVIATNFIALQTSPTYNTYATTAPTDRKVWRFFGTNSGTFVIQSVNDAYSASQGSINFNTNGTSITTIAPGSDNLTALGVSSLRYSIVYAATGTINTSDAREKKWLGPLSAAELAVAKRLAANIGTYQWLASLEEKGDAARLHVGVLAQGVGSVQEAFAAEGLDAHRYGMFTYDEWKEDPGTPAIAATEGNPGHPGIPGHSAGNRYGVRYSELTVFILAAQEQRLRVLENI